jgi:hypothetical protein
MIIAGYLPTRDEWEAALKEIQRLEQLVATLTAENEELKKEQSNETNRV